MPCTFLGWPYDLLSHHLSVPASPCPCQHLVVSSCRVSCSDRCTLVPHCGFYFSFPDANYVGDPFLCLPSASPPCWDVSSCLVSIFYLVAFLITESWEFFTWDASPLPDVWSADNFSYSGTHVFMLFRGSFGSKSFSFWWSSIFHSPLMDWT